MVLPVVIAGIALGSFLYVRVFRPHALRVRDADRQLLITVADLEAFLPRFVARTDAELLTKTQFPGGRVELKYEYLHPDDARPLYVLCVVEVHPSRKSAREAYAAHAHRETPEAPFEGVAYSQINASAPWGDSAQLADLTEKGKPRGYSFLCRQEDRLLRVELFGLRFGDEERFKDILYSRLELLGEFQP